MKTPLRDRFNEKVDRGDQDDCWDWLGFVDKAGYGRIRDANGRAGESAYAHRVSYELHIGSIPEDLVLDHLCRNRWCVNPAHLEAVTMQENLRRGEGSRILTSGRCDRGHDQSVHGYYKPNGKRGRCRECRRQQRAGTAEITERDHQKAILDLTQMLGWRRAHFRPAQTSKGWRTPVAADGEGFPDLVLVRDRVVIAELKKEKGKPTETQVEWLDGLARAGAEVYMWRPSDLDEIATILGKRWTFETGLDGRWLLRTELVSYAPQSLWLAGRGRVDSVKAAA